MGKGKKDVFDLSKQRISDVKIADAAAQARKGKGGRPRKDGSPAQPRPEKNITGGIKSIDPKVKREQPEDSLPAIAPKETGMTKAETGLAIDVILARKNCVPLEEMVDLIQATDNEKLKMEGYKELMKYQYAQKKSVDTLVSGGINFNITLQDFRSGNGEGAIDV
jgi:hypothetical protein